MTAKTDAKSHELGGEYTEFGWKDVWYQRCGKSLGNNILLSCRRCRMLITPRPWIGQMIIWQDGNMNENGG
ncbi:hypothetical protein M6B38_215045 [Iris pallida]|uniref:Uncharacterized protein n=1 Tax=Iris pallida TaxID=29817 RepID=A0AAX6E1F7_IRIPA|nr:hypothetical protein M6B38_215045 [Iris pallida]